MNKRLFVCGALAAFTLMGCNSIGGKETLLARVDGENIYVEDLDMIRLQVGASRGMGKNFEESKNELFYNAAEVSQAVAEFPELDTRWNKYKVNLEDRLLAMVYQRFYAMECLMQSDTDLKKYFTEHKADFGGDSADYLVSRGAVAEALFLERNAAEFDAFVNEAIASRQEPAKVNVAFVDGDSATVAKAEQDMLSGMPLERVPGIQRTQVNEGSQMEIWKLSQFQKAFFGADADTMAVGSTRIFSTGSAEKPLVIVKLIFKKEAFIPSEDKLRDQLKKEYISNYKDLMVEKSIKEVHEKYKIVAEKVVPPDPEKFYESNKDKFMTKPGLEVYHIQAKDSAALANLVEGKTLDLEAFKKLASEKSENALTAPNGGFLGHVKKSHALPYGIGLLPRLFVPMDKKFAGEITNVLRDDNGSFQVFYISKVIPAEVKPYDRAKADVKDFLLNDGTFDLDPDYVLVTRDGAPLYTEKDVKSIMDEEPGMIRNNKTRERLATMLAECAGYGLEARSVKLDHSWEFQALLRQSRQRYILSHYEILKAAKIQAPEDSLKALFEKSGNPFRKSMTYEESKGDLTDFLHFPKNMVERDYYFNRTLYKNRTLEDVSLAIKENRIRDFRRAREERRRAEAWDKAKVFYYNSSITVPEIENSLSYINAHADSLIAARELSKVENIWKSVRNQYADNDSIYAKASYEIARIQAENDMYEFAETEYYAFLKMWSDHPDVEKAMFSRGFILNENLQKNEEALVVLEEFLQKFPNSELKESVVWLVENIKSNGKMAEELMKKISAEE